VEPRQKFNVAERTKEALHPNSCVPGPPKYWHCSNTHDRWTSCRKQWRSVPTAAAATSPPSRLSDQWRHDRAGEKAAHQPAVARNHLTGEASDLTNLASGFASPVKQQTNRGSSKESTQTAGHGAPGLEPAVLSSFAFPFDEQRSTTPGRELLAVTHRWWFGIGGYWVVVRGGSGAAPRSVPTRTYVDAAEPVLYAAPAVPTGFFLDSSDGSILCAMLGLGAFLWRLVLLT
jgi:hypothetical protein